jgi:hypothetical protein
LLRLLGQVLLIFLVNLFFLFCYLSSFVLKVAAPV